MTKNEIKTYFSGKCITVMGLGLLGRNLQVIQFLHKMGAKILVTDLKTEQQLAPSLKKLAKLEGIAYVLGEHRLADFEDTDMVIRAPNAPLDSPYLKAARDAGVPVEMDASLFAALCPADVTIIGVTGTRGKTTVTHLISEILKAAGKRVHMGGNVQGGVTLPLLLKVKAGDFVVLELDSWQLQGFGDRKISPHIAVFTSFMPDHLNYYKGDLVRYFEDKANIYRHQTVRDHLVIHEDVLKNHPVKTLAEVHRALPRHVPAGWKTKLLGEHNRGNIACALHVAEIVGVPLSVQKKALAAFAPVSGRMEPIGTKKGVLVVNDNNSTTPDATIAALRALGNPKKKNIVLIFGGDDKKIDMSPLVSEIPKWCRAAVLFKERGTDTIRDAVFAKASDTFAVYEEEGLPATVSRAFSLAKRGDVLLYSPAFSSFGKYFANEYDRGDQFASLVKRLG